MIELRPYQNECIEAIFAAEKNGTNRQLVALPNGHLRTLRIHEGAGLSPQTFVPHKVAIERPPVRERVRRLSFASWLKSATGAL